MKAFGTALLTIGVLSISPALAQEATDANGKPVVTETQGSMTGNHDKSLSSKLSKTGGVITPKSNIDPGIHADAPVPHPNSTPVIPPSATGGGTAK